MPLKFTVRGKKKKKEGGAGEQGGWDVASLRSASSTRSDGRSLSLSLSLSLSRARSLSLSCRGGWNTECVQHQQDQEFAKAAPLGCEGKPAQNQKVDSWYEEKCPQLN